MKKILLLGGSAQQIVAIETAKRLGLYTVLCDYLPDNPGQYHADKFYLASTTEKEKILQIAQSEGVNYIIAYASDPAAPTAAYVAEKMGLPTNPYKSVEILCNKDLFRSFLEQNGFNTPKARGYDTKEQAFSDIEFFSFPVLTKPVDSSGSKGVTVVRGLQDLDSAVDYAFSYSRCHRMIIEEYLEKKHPYLIGGDIFVLEGKIIQWGLMNCHRDSAVNPLVPVGKSFPLILDKQDFDNVKDTLQSIVGKLGIQHGAMNVELLVDEKNRVFPVDLGPRSGGNMIPDLLGMIFHCDVVEMCIRAAMGSKVIIPDDKGESFYATLNLHSAQNGIFDHVEFDDDIAQYIIRKNVYVKTGDKVNLFVNSADALGIIFFKFPDKDVMIEMEEHMNEHVKIVLRSGCV